MLFDLSNAASTFQLFANGIFRDASDQLVTVYFDDTLISSKYWMLHDTQGCQVLDGPPSKLFVCKAGKHASLASPT